MKKNLLITALLLSTGTWLTGQTQRYLDEVFTSVTVTANIIYGNNISVLTGSPAAVDLKLDVYEPAGDTLTERPLVLIFHTGSFLPAIVNGQPTGSPKDSAVVEMCRRFAKKGYVAAAVGYRLGWNPISTDQNVRTSTLINAAYRGVQDAHTAVRFFRKEKSTYKIDDTRIALGGIGTGGYISLAFAYFDKYPELEIDKFIDFNQNPPKPFIDTALSGDFQGTLARALNSPNHVGFSSAVNIVFNCGGALGDSSWLEMGDVPVVAFHCTKDPNAPYKTGAVIVPTTGDFVVEASGSYDVVRLANFFDVNNPLKMASYNDPYTTRANTINDGYEGLFPFVTPAPQPAINCNGILLPGQEQGAPWDWWDEATYKGTIVAYNTAGITNQNPDTMACNAKRGNPDMSSAKGRTYIDTIQGYLSQRLVNVLNLPGSTGVNERIASEEIGIFPNPSNGVINIVSGKNNIQFVEIVDITGKTILKSQPVNAASYRIAETTLSEGIYFVKVSRGDNTTVHKVIVY